MSRKRAHRKHRPAGIHPLDAIAAVQPFPQEAITRILIKVHESFDDLKKGGTDCDHFDRMAAMLNVGLVRAESIGKPAEQIFLRAQMALRESDDIYGRHGRFGFTGPGLEAMVDAIALYEQVLTLSTPRQMDDAQKECIRRIQGGKTKVPPPLSTELAR